MPALQKDPLYQLSYQLSLETHRGDSIKTLAYRLFILYHLIMHRDLLSSEASYQHGAGSKTARVLKKCSPC